MASMGVDESTFCEYFEWGGRRVALCSLLLPLQVREHFWHRIFNEYLITTHGLVRDTPEKK